MTVRRPSTLSVGVGAVEGLSAGDAGVLSPDSPTAVRLRQVLVARYGWELGLEAWQDVMVYAWEHGDSLMSMQNPLGYLFRVAQSSVRRQRRWFRSVALPPVPPDRLPDVEPGLAAALAGLSSRQRVAVVLVHAHGWTHEEAAAALRVDVSTLRNHLQRGLEKLRVTLGVDDV